MTSLNKQVKKDLKNNNITINKLSYEYNTIHSGISSEKLDKQFINQSQNDIPDSISSHKNNNPPMNENSSIKLRSRPKIKTGRWSSEEHYKFVKAICKFGNEWKKVQQYILTRNSTQARSHAQKFFLRMKKKFNFININSDQIQSELMKLPEECLISTIKECAKIHFDISSLECHKLIQVLTNFSKNQYTQISRANSELNQESFISSGNLIKNENELFELYLKNPENNSSTSINVSYDKGKEMTFKIEKKVKKQKLRTNELITSDKNSFIFKTINNTTETNKKLLKFEKNDIKQNIKIVNQQVPKINEISDTLNFSNRNTIIHDDELKIFAPIKKIKNARKYPLSASSNNIKVNNNYNVNNTKNNSLIKNKIMYHKELANDDLSGIPYILNKNNEIIIQKQVYDKKTSKMDLIQTNKFKLIEPLNFSNGMKLNFQKINQLNNYKINFPMKVEEERSNPFLLNFNIQENLEIKEDENPNLGDDFSSICN